MATAVTLNFRHQFRLTGVMWSASCFHHLLVFIAINPLSNAHWGGEVGFIFTPFFLNSLLIAYLELTGIVWSTSFFFYHFPNIFRS